jgi:hypothetical protein
MTYISVALRRLVMERADFLCEYCLISQWGTFFPFEIDHVIAAKHGGETTEANLCLSCPDCNAFKGSDIGSIDRETRRLTPLYNPREQTWSDHFTLEGPIIIPLTPEGRVTVFLLQLNETERVTIRSTMMDLGLYPPE